jgi:hypothetical protein
VFIKKLKLYHIYMSVVYFIRTFNFLLRAIPKNLLEKLLSILC